MSFSKKLAKSAKGRSWKLRPEILLLPRIPKPMHGLAPRVVLGKKWWNEIRQKTYASAEYHCVACGVHKVAAKGPKWLEAHEVYRTCYEAGRLIFVEVVPLCNFCHNYIHQGRLEYLLENKKITQQRYAAIIQHGDRIVRKAGLVKAPPYEGPMAEWSKWRLVIGRRMYKPLCKSLEEWKERFGEGSDE